MFSLVSSRYERASLIVTSNKPFSAWGEIFGDDVVAVAMFDRGRALEGPASRVTAHVCVAVDHTRTHQFLDRHTAHEVFITPNLSSA
jgi:IstB-like ATP binding protein